MMLMDPPAAAAAVPDSRGTNLFRADPDYAGLLQRYLDPKLYAHLLPHFERLSRDRRVIVESECRRLEQLDVPDAVPVAAVDLLDPEQCITGKPRLSKRHRVRDNLLGVPGFCPVIRRTARLREFAAVGLGDHAG